MHRRCGQIRQVHSSRRQSQILIKTSIVTEKEAVYCVAIVYDEFLKRENICQRESRENTGHAVRSSAIRIQSAHESQGDPD